jgi:RND family efflux transporter MFP subunit
MVANSVVIKKLLGASLLMSFSLAACSKKQPEAQAPPPPLVEVQELNNSNLTNTSELIGSLEAQQKVFLAPRVDGRIVEIAKQEGDTVRKGELIVQLQLSREQGEVNAAVSDVNIQRANLSNAQAELRAAEAEQASAVAAVEQSKADLRQQEAELELAKVNLERTKFLVQQGAQSQQALDDRTRDINAAQAQTDALKAALNASEKALQASKERVSAALAAIDGEKAALDRAQTQVGIATDNLEFNRVVAPIDGTIGNIIPKVGDYLQPGDRITTITQDNALELNVNIPAEEASRLKVGLPIQIIDRQGKEIASSKISFIAPKADAGDRTILVKAVFNNNGSLLDDGFARARITWSEQPGILVPTEAVSRIAGKTFVFVAEEKKQENGETTLVAKQKPVTLGAIQGQAYQVISGIKPGEKIITSGILNLADDTPITTESLASQK